MIYDATAEPDKQRGNCLSAVVASLLELPIEDVPNFVQNHVDTGGERDWWNELHAFIDQHDHQMCYLRASSGGTFPAPEPDEYYTVTGKSPRDPAIYHIVIYQNGHMVFDPHPDRTGLTTIDAEYHWSIRPTGPTP